MENNIQSNAENAEQAELDSLIERGVSFKVGKRTFLIHEPYLGTLDILSDLYLKMGEVDLEAMKNGFISERKHIMNRTARLCAKVVAVSVLNSKWKIRLYGNILTAYLLWKVKPSQLRKLVDIVNAASNIGDFIASIRLMSGERTTRPTLIEQNQKA